MTLKTDIPTRETHTRLGFVRARVTAVDYLVDFGEVQPEFAFYSGALLLSVGTAVICRWRGESAMWVITGLTTESSPTEQVTAADVSYTPANEGHW